MEVETPADFVNTDRTAGFSKEVAEAPLPPSDDLGFPDESGFPQPSPDEQPDSGDSTDSSSTSEAMRCEESDDKDRKVGPDFAAPSPEKGSAPLPGERVDGRTSPTDHRTAEPVALSPETSGRQPVVSMDVRTDRPRQRRLSKRKQGADTCCPICSVTVRLTELESHFTQEVEKLTTISKNLKKPRKEGSCTKQSFELVKHNRENRLTAKIARYKLRARNEVQCPVCNLKLFGTSEDVNKHVLQCLQHVENSDSDNELVVDEDESFEEYEFGDETRTRAISLLPGGHRALPGERITRTTEDEDLNVDIDDTLAYGKPQYTELDVIPCTISEREDKEREQLRKAFLGDPTAQPQVLESRKWSNSEEPPDSIYSDIIAINSHSDHVVTSLKERIKDLEEQNRNAKCLICMETYTKPVVSITCWHVYCEECWLMTMGVKKLCPQCNMIVFPSDLRRIYL